VGQGLGFDNIKTKKFNISYMNAFSYTVLIPLVPLFMFLLIGLGGMKFKPMVSGIAGTIGLGFIAVPRP
jgi:hypothetical protein